MRTTAHGAVVLMFLYDEKSAVDPRRAARYQCFYFGTRDEWEIPVNSHLECGHGVAVAARDIACSVVDASLIATCDSVNAC